MAGRIVAIPSRKHSRAARIARAIQRAVIRTQLSTVEGRRALLSIADELDLDGALTLLEELHTAPDDQRQEILARLIESSSDRVKQSFWLNEAWEVAKKRGQPQLATEILQRWLSVDPEDTQALTRLEAECEVREDWEQLVELLGPAAAEIRAAAGPGPALGAAMKFLKTKSVSAEASDVREAVSQLRQGA